MNGLRNSVYDSGEQHAFKRCVPDGRRATGYRRDLRSRGLWLGCLCVAAFFVVATLGGALDLGRIQGSTSSTVQKTPSAVLPGVYFKYVEGSATHGIGQTDVTAINTFGDVSKLPPSQNDSMYPGGFVFGFRIMSNLTFTANNSVNLFRWNPESMASQSLLLHDGTNYVANIASAGDEVSVSGAGRKGYTGIPAVGTNAPSWAGWFDSEFVLVASPTGAGTYDCVGIQWFHIDTVRPGSVIVDSVRRPTEAFGFVRRTVTGVTPAQLWQWTTGCGQPVYMMGYVEPYAPRIKSYSVTGKWFAGMSSVTTATARSYYSKLSGVTQEEINVRNDGSGTTVDSDEDMSSIDASDSPLAEVAEGWESLLDIAGAQDKVKNFLNGLKAQFDPYGEFLRDLFWFLDPWEVW